MKTLHWLLVALLLSLYSSEEDEGENEKKYCDSGTPSKAKDCHDRPLSPNTDYKYCCFLKFKDGELECESMTQKEYDEIEDLMDKSGEVESIDCGSNYIIISLLSLMLLFL